MDVPGVIVRFWWKISLVQITHLPISSVRAALKDYWKIHVFQISARHPSGFSFVNIRAKVTCDFHDNSRGNRGSRRRRRKVKKLGERSSRGMGIGEKMRNERSKPERSWVEGTTVLRGDETWVAFVPPFSSDGDVGNWGLLGWRPDARHPPSSLSRR